LTCAEAAGLLAGMAARKRQALADEALAVYAGTAAALAGTAGYRALLRWTAALRAGEAEETAAVTWL
jgi:hypothetical protein